MSWNCSPRLFGILILALVSLAPIRVHAFCITEPDSITLIDERLAETPVTWVCDMEQWWFEYQEYCDLNGSRSDLPQCPMVELPDLLERLKVATGEDTSFVHHSCEQFVDCRLVRGLVPLDWEKEWSPCGLKNNEEVLDLAEIGEYLEPGDLAATKNNCGEPSWRRSVVVDAGSPPQVKVLASDGGNWTTVGGRMVSWQKVGDPCCDPPEGWGQEVGEGEVHSSAVRFQVDGADEWNASEHSAHLFAASDLALRFHYSVFANTDVWIEDHEDSVRYDVFAWPPEGFQEISVGDEWCQLWCGNEDTPDSTGEPPFGGGDRGGSDLAGGAGGEPETGRLRGSCGVAAGDAPGNRAGSLALALAALVLLLRTGTRRGSGSILMLLLLAGACDRGNGKTPGGDARSDEVSLTVCSGLSRDECEAADTCWALKGWPAPEACLVWADEPTGAPLFAACVSVDIVCEPTYTWAAPPADPTEAWLFPNCIPDDWGDPEGPFCVPDCPHTECDECCASEDHVCDPDGRCCLPDCAGKECGDDGCGGECCGDEPMEAGAFSCCNSGISGGTCSEYCPGWGSEPPVCIPPVECIQSCIEDCPPGWDCINYAFYGTDVAFYCFPEPLGPPCQPCETDADCPGGILWEVDRCAAVLGEIPTCVSECSAIPKLPCAPWHSCVPAETVAGEVLDVCVPDPGQCECLPEVETCDGEDNDCDGETDEDCPLR